MDFPQCAHSNNFSLYGVPFETLYRLVHIGIMNDLILPSEHLMPVHRFFTPNLRLIVSPRKIKFLAPERTGKRLGHCDHANLIFTDFQNISIACI